MRSWTERSFHFRDRGYNCKMHLEINRSVKRRDIGLVWKLHAPGDGFLCPPCMSSLYVFSGRDGVLFPKKSLITVYTPSSLGVITMYDVILTVSKTQFLHVRFCIDLVLKVRIFGNDLLSCSHLKYAWMRFMRFMMDVTECPLRLILA